jgi:hypothetical protein
MIGEKECAPSASAGDLATFESYTPREDEDQEVPRIQMFREHLASFVIVSEISDIPEISEEQKLSFDPYPYLHQHAE